MDRITRFQEAISAVMDEYIVDHVHAQQELKYEKEIGRAHV